MSARRRTKAPSPAICLALLKSVFGEDVEEVAIPTHTPPTPEHRELRAAALQVVEGFEAMWEWMSDNEPERIERRGWKQLKSYIDKLAKLARG